ncbi:MAG: hypothetical protein OHK93_002423 [Ramalina farinacea]|uniref:Rhodopsin domain-containing protein n=1 Tax=Ramalina farinacea TaxID=258253 RepID=A0AA43QU16_9LECA|nr:hypothetical protein [Ramalina farinacea]
MPPPESPPLGKPGFDIHADQRGRIIGSLVATLVITDIFVVLRLVSRKLARVGYWWDDVWAVIAMLFSNACIIILFCELPNGYGRHIYIWQPATELARKERSWLRTFFVFELFFHTATTLSKFSILAFYYRIFSLMRFRTILIWVAVVCIVYMIGIDITIVLQCRPVSYAWERVDPNVKGTCFNVTKFFVGSGSFNVVLNFVVFVLPLPLLWRLRTTLRQQIILTAIFTLAGFVVLVSIIWIVVLSSIEQTDVTWGYINAGIWSALEPNMAVVCACIPSLKPLVTALNRGVFQHPLLRNRLRSTTKSGSSSGRKWFGSKGTNSDGRFSSLDENNDDLAPLGHGVSVRGGMDAKEQSLEHGDVEMQVPQSGIGVKTDVVVSTSERLAYNDRLY